VRLTPWHRWCGRSDEHLIEFVANNVDRHNISFHSLFYKLALLAPPPQAGGPAAATAAGLAELRAMPPDQCHLVFSVRNISGKPMRLRVAWSAAGRLEPGARSSAPTPQPWPADTLGPRRGAARRAPASSPCTSRATPTAHRSRT
jgi:hypothetical protein